MARPRILFAWEMGANFGHAHKVAEVARALNDRAEITVIARDILPVRRFLGDVPATLLPAPHLSRPLRTARGANYVGNLLSEGWCDPEVLGPLVASWSALIDMVAPDMLVAQAAPTALLAARGSGLACGVLGSGFDAPALADPMPPFEPGTGADDAAAQEAQALAVANPILAARGAPPLSAFRDLHDGALPLLCAWPETDHYGDREKIEPGFGPYLGQMLSEGAGASVSWAHGGERPKVLAYLRPGTPQAAAGFGALAELGPQLDAILAAPGLTPQDAATLRGRGVQVVDGPVRLGPLLEDCALGITHASSGLGAELIRAGVFQIGLPTHREQDLYMRALGRSRLGAGLTGPFDSQDVVKLMSRVLADSTLRAHVGTVALDIARRFAVPAQVQAADRILGKLD